MVVLASDYRLPLLGVSSVGVWVNGGIGLSLIIIGMIVVVAKR